MVDFTGGTWRSLVDGAEISAIPDIGDYQWYADEGEGTTLNANIGDVDMTVSTSDAWVSDTNSIGGVHLNFGEDDQANTNSEVTHDSFTAFGWHRPEDIDGVMMEFGPYNNVDNGLLLRLESEGFTLTTGDGSNFNNDLSEVGSVETGSWYFASITFDDSLDEQLRLIIWDESELLLDKTTDTSYFGEGSNEFTMGSPSGGDRVTNSGDYDFYGYEEGSVLEKPDLEELWEATNAR